MSDKPAVFFVCTSCKPHHISNCPKCHGYGLWRNGSPVTACEANGQRIMEVDISVPCPVCQSTYKGYLPGMDGKFVVFESEGKP